MCLTNDGQIFEIQQSHGAYVDAEVQKKKEKLNLTASKKNLPWSIARYEKSD